MLSTKIPYVYTFHSPVYKEVVGERQVPIGHLARCLTPPSRATKSVERRILERASVVVTLSDFTADEMRAITRPGKTTWQKIPGGLKTDYFSPLPRLEPPLDMPRPIILTARRLVERTGVELLVAAMPEILAEHPTAQLVVTGDGPRRTAIEQQLIDLGIGDSVHVLGRLYDDDLLAWYRSADLAVTPTLALEGFGLSTAEAMSSGTPVVVTPVGANPEVVRGLGDEFVAASTSPHDIAVAINRALADPARLATARSHARGLIHPQLNWDEVADRYLDVYRQTLGIHVAVSA